MLIFRMMLMALYVLLVVAAFSVVGWAVDRIL
jgi:hypothetical protein